MRLIPSPLKTDCYRAIVLGCVLWLGTATGPGHAKSPDAASSAGCNPYIAASLKHARQDGDANTLLTLPDFGPLESQDVQVGGHGRKISLLLKPRINLNVLLARLNQRRDRSIPVSSVDELTAFQGTDITGLEKSETYFAAADGAVTDMLECNPPGSVPSPGCSHWIIHGAFLVKASYGRDWLPKWRNIRNNLSAVIDRCGGA